MNLEIRDLAILAIHLALVILLCLLPKCQDTDKLPQQCAIYGSAINLTPVFMLEWQILYPLNHLFNL